MAKLKGAGNIGKGEGVYTAGDIVREGPQGESGRKGQSDYSAGRGGTGNIGHESQGDGGVPPLAADYVPESATMGSQYSEFHTGRGGEGNIHKAKYGGHSKPQKEHGEGGHGLVEKAKHAVGLDKHHGDGDKK